MRVKRRDRENFEFSENLDRLKARCACAAGGLIPNGADTVGHNPCRAIAFRGQRRTARPLEARLRPIPCPRRGPRLVQHVIQVTACSPGENLWCSTSFVGPICISPTMRGSAECDSVGSAEASDGRLARFGRIDTEARKDAGHAHAVGGTEPGGASGSTIPTYYVYGLDAISADVIVRGDGVRVAERGTGRTLVDVKQESDTRKQAGVQLVCPNLVRRESAPETMTTRRSCLSFP